MVSSAATSSAVVKTRFVEYNPLMTWRSNQRNASDGGCEVAHSRPYRPTAAVVGFLLVGLLIAPAAIPVLPGKSTMQLTSTAFKEGDSIPTQYTCQGKNISPPLKWSGAPPETKSFALIADDPDAPRGTWVHWVIYDLPAATTELPENTAKTQYVPGNARQGINDFKQLGYGGPCPPPGKPHRYYFKIYALDAELDLKPGLTKKDVEAAMLKHILAQGQLMGTYQRK